MDNAKFLIVVLLLVFVGFLIYLGSNFEVESLCCMESPEKDKEVCRNLMERMSDAAENKSFDSPEMCYDSEGEPLIEELEGTEEGEMIRWVNRSVVN